MANQLKLHTKLTEPCPATNLREMAAWEVIGWVGDRRGKRWGAACMLRAAVGPGAIPPRPVGARAPRHAAASAPLEIRSPLWMGRGNTAAHFHEKAEMLPQCSRRGAWPCLVKAAPGSPPQLQCSLPERQGRTLPLQVRREQRALTVAKTLKVKLMKTFHAFGFKSLVLKAYDPSPQQRAAH